MYSVFLSVCDTGTDCLPKFVSLKLELQLLKVSHLSAY
jgi:hypothetical protein